MLSQMSADEWEFVELCDGYGVKRPDGSYPLLSPQGTGWWLFNIELDRNEDGVPFTVTHWARRKESQK